MAKIAKKHNNVNPLTHKLKQSASQIWLAGLGAYSKAEEEGNKLFDTLVREGESAKDLLESIIDKPLSFYQEALGDVRECVEEVKDKAVGSWDRIEKAFDERVANALHRLNIPTRQDVADLAKQVMQCKAELRQMQTASNKMTTTKNTTAAKKTTDKKITAKTASGATAKPAATKAVTDKAATRKTAANKTTAAKTVAAKIAVSKTIKAVGANNKAAAKKASVKKKPVKKTSKAG